MKYNKTGLLADFARGKARILGEVEYDDTKRIEGMYYNTPAGPIAITYIYPLKSRDKLISIMNRLNEVNKQADDVTNEMFYKELPKLR